MQMAMSSTENGQRTRPMDTAPIHMLTERGIKDIGSMTCSMDRVERSGKTAAAMMALITEG